MAHGFREHSQLLTGQSCQVNIRSINWTKTVHFMTAAKLRQRLLCCYEIYLIKKQQTKANRIISMIKKSKDYFCFHGAGTLVEMLLLYGWPQGWN